MNTLSAKIDKKNDGENEFELFEKTKIKFDDEKLKMNC